MGFYELLNGIGQYIGEAAMQLFTLNNDAYPAVGVQPYEGEPVHR